MTTTRKPKRIKGKAGKLKLKKETLKDLTERDARRVKGGLMTAATDVACSRGACGPTWGATCTCGCQVTDMSCAGGLCYRKI